MTKRERELEKTIRKFIIEAAVAGAKSFAEAIAHVLKNKGSEEAIHMNELIRIERIVDAIHFPGYSFLVDTVGGRLFSIRVRYVEPDVMSGVPEEQNGRLWVFPEGQTTGQIVQTCFKAIQTSLEHRAREHFHYRGKTVLMPHFDIDEVWEMMPAGAVHAEPIFRDEVMAAHTRLSAESREELLRRLGGGVNVSVPNAQPSGPAPEPQSPFAGKWCPN